MRALFQSLFYWMFLLKSRKGVALLENIFVSILVLLDVPLKVLLLYFCFRDEGVSILVLLDVPLKGLHVGIRRHWQLCFNPCFIGCSS